jgi:hypothetical protein
MSAPDMKQQDDLSPEAALARATRSRGDIFREWKPRSLQRAGIHR